MTENTQENKRKFYKYLSSVRINEDVLQAVDRKTKRQMMLSVSEDGELYDKKGASLTKPQQKRYWTALFEFALEYKYNLVPEGFFDFSFDIEIL